MKTHEKPGFTKYVFVDRSGDVTVLDKRDAGHSSVQDRLYRASSVIATFDDGDIEVVKCRKGMMAQRDPT